MGYNKIIFGLIYEIYIIKLDLKVIIFNLFIMIKVLIYVHIARRFCSKMK